MSGGRGTDCKADVIGCENVNMRELSANFRLTSR
jgi:hypothetical protein